MTKVQSIISHFADHKDQSRSGHVNIDEADRVIFNLLLEDNCLTIEDLTLEGYR